MVLVALALVATATSASASVSYTYVTDLVANGGTYSAASNEVIKVNIYLQETLTGADVGKSVVNADGGLGTFGTSLNKLSGGGTKINAANATFYPLTWNGGSNTKSPTSGLVDAQGFVGNTAIAGPGVPTDGSGKILLLTAELNASAAASSTTFKLFNADAFFGFGPNNTTFTSFYDLDANGTNGSQTWTGANNNLFQFTVQVGAVVPEPSSMALCGLAVAGLGVGAWRRRKAKLAAAAQATVDPSTIA